MGTAKSNPAEIEIAALRLEMQRQLARSNAEFEEFISMAAHNLREPLRDINAFSQLLAQTNTGRLDSEAIGFLDRIRQGAASAQTVLAAVVDYWASGIDGREPVRTDMQAVLYQALLRAEEQIAARGAIVTHDPLPPACGDFEILTKVLHHLIQNAIAYGDAVSPRVHVSFRRVEPGCEFSVRDNGPGIEPAFQSRIFGAFKRLHGREYPGSGLGLAFCKRAVEGLGGRMRVESTEGAGSTFYFTLPAA